MAEFKKKSIIRSYSTTFSEIFVNTNNKQSPWIFISHAMKEVLNSLIALKQGLKFYVELPTVFNNIYHVKRSSPDSYIGQTATEPRCELFAFTLNCLTVFVHISPSW